MLLIWKQQLVLDTIQFLVWIVLESFSLPASLAAMSKSLDFSWSPFPCLNLEEVQVVSGTITA